MCLHCVAYVVSGVGGYLTSKQIYQKKRAILDIFYPHAFRYVAPSNYNFLTTNIWWRHLVREFVYSFGGAEK